MLGPILFVTYGKFYPDFGAGLRPAGRRDRAAESLDDVFCDREAES
jgi:hypothetical protein